MDMVYVTLELVNASVKLAGEELIVVAQTVLGNQTAMGEDSVTNCMTHLYAQTVNQAGWVQVVMMFVFMVHLSQTIQYVIALRHVSMVKGVTLSVQEMVCVIQMEQETVSATH